MHGVNPLPSSPRARRGARVSALLAALALAAWGCGGAPAGRGGAAFHSGGAESIEVLGAGIVAAFAAGDTAALERFRVTAREHDELLFPSFPAARQEPPFPAELAWENIQVRNAAALYGWLPVFGAERISFAGVRCAGAAEPYPTFTIHQDCSVTLRRPDGRTGQAQLFRSVVEMGGRYKVIRYHRD